MREDVALGGWCVGLVHKLHTTSVSIGLLAPSNSKFDRNRTRMTLIGQIKADKSQNLRRKIRSIRVIRVLYLELLACAGLYNGSRPQMAQIESVSIRVHP